MKTSLVAQLAQGCQPPAAQCDRVTGSNLECWSRDAERIFGLRAEEVRSKTFNEWKFVFNEEHGGTITATSAGVDQGATFTMELPILVQLHQPIQKQFLQEVADTSRLSELKILVVDDESDSRDIVTFLLEQAGATACSYAAATEALQALTQFLFDFLVSAVGMPEMDRYMLMRQVRMSTSEINHSIRAIALTAYASDFDQQQALSAGFQRHLSKPIDPDKLLETLLELMDESTES